MDVQADREREELLPRLGQIYGWLGRASGLTDLQRTSLRQVQTSLAATWPRLLPLERAEVFDLVLGEFCAALARGSVNVANNNSDQREQAFGEIQSRVQQIKSLYEPSGSSADAWADEFCSFGGISKSKLQRVSGVTLEALKRVMDGVLEDVRSAPVRVGRLAPPSADTVLFHAQSIAQTANSRFRVFLLLLRSIRSVYAVNVAENRSPLELKTSEFEHVAGAVEFVTAETTKELFERLPTKRQVLDVDNARTMVFATCEELTRRLALPSSVPLMYSLTASLRPSTPGYNGTLPAHTRPALPRPHAHARNRSHDEPVPGPTSAPSSSHATEQESLAHGGAAISDRKARRYYGTSAAAWANGRQAFGRW
ncbi:hypothetical protein JCM10450v2_006512 [Rhodotorula kratochvilovae]